MNVFPSGHLSEITSVELDTNGLLLTASIDGTARLFPKDDGYRRSSMAWVAPHKCPINSALFHPTDSNLVYIGCTGGIASFDIRNCSIVQKSLFKDFPETSPFQDDLNSLAFSSCGKRMVATDDSGTITLFDLSKDVNTSYERMISKHASIASCALFGPNDDQILSGGFDYMIQMIDINNGKRIDGVSVDNNGQGQIVNPPFVYSLDIQSDLIAFGLGNGSVGVLQKPDRKTARKQKINTNMISQWNYSCVDAHNYVVSKVKFGEKSMLYSCSYDGTVALRNILTNQSETINIRKSGATKAINLATIGSSLFVADEKRNIHVYVPKL